ncbi:lysozyme inhibitor LprI family protein [Sulfitobacter albidus]|nr:lysozyme inhibitor LprI family protein [Sulfitobacter albidus]
MRLVLALVCVAGTAAAQEPPYADTATEVCLNRANGYAAQLACVGRSADMCIATPAGGSTVGTGYCLDRERDFWDRLLNDHYQATLSQAVEYDAELDAMSARTANIPRQAGALREMQRRWIGFRDAACAYAASQWGGGTGAGPAALDCLMRQTARQALALRLWAR